jgi:hypothetical protein
MVLPGSFSVGATGAASYNIPIALPPGAAGMAPSLSLGYSSQGSNGLLGIGWSLGAYPVLDVAPRRWRRMAPSVALITTATITSAWMVRARGDQRVLSAGRAVWVRYMAAAAAVAAALMPSAAAAAMASSSSPTRRAVDRERAAPMARSVFCRIQERGIWETSDERGSGSVGSGVPRVAGSGAALARSGGTRSSSFGYDAASGLLTQEVIVPGTPFLAATKGLHLRRIRQQAERDRKGRHRLALVDYDL